MVDPLGWLSTYLSGYLHRDVTIMNVFMTKEPVKRKAFEIPEGFLDHLFSLGDELVVAEILWLYGQVEQLAAGLGISDECIGFIIDGDMAIPWDDCFSKANPETKLVSGCQDIFKAALDTTHRAHLNSCPWDSRSQHKWG